MEGEVTTGGEALGVFVGSFTHTLDPKRRLTIPSEWRFQAGPHGGLYVLPGLQEPCLCVFPVRELARRIERIKTHSLADSRANQFARMVASRSDLATWDSQGRIRVKDELLDYAKLSSQVLLVGVFDRFELWNPEQWKASTAGDPASLNDAARYVGF